MWIPCGSAGQMCTSTQKQLTDKSEYKRTLARNMKQSDNIVHCYVYYDKRIAR